MSLSLRTAYLAPTKRKPLRTFKEMAEEFGVSVSTLSGLMATRSGPQPRLNHSGGCAQTRNKWFDPDEMRAWWKSVQRMNELKPKPIPREPRKPIPMSADLNRSYRPKHAAELLGIGEATLWRWIKERPGFPQPIRLSARCTVLRGEDLTAWLAAQVSNPASPPVVRKGEKA